MLDAIRSAQRRIIFESFIYEEGVVGDPVHDRAGGSGETRCDRPHCARCLRWRASGVRPSKLTECRRRDPMVQSNHDRGRSRRQTTAPTARCSWSTARIGFTGGIGLADHWLGNAQDLDHWRDTQFKVTGPVVRALEASFYENWIESGGRSAPALDPERPAQGTASFGRAVEQSHRRGEQRQTALPPLARVGAAAHRHSVALLHPRRVEPLGALGSAQARRPHPDCHRW